MAILRGLLYLLINQQLSLILYIRKKHNYIGKTLFKNINAQVALSKIFIDILEDLSLNSIYFIINALNEYIVDLLKLLDFVAQKSSISSYVKQIVSSRNQLDIEERLEQVGYKVRLSLKLNVESVLIAISIFIK